MTPAPSACPYCGAASWGSTYCGTCGAQLEAEPPPEWPAEPAPAASASPGPIEFLAAGFAAAAVFLALISTFLPWAPRISYWEFNSVEDLALVLAVLAILACLGLRLALPHVRLPRAAVAVLVPALLALLVLDGFEVVAEVIDLGSSLQVGVVVALLASGALAGALLLLLFVDARALRAPLPTSGRDPLLLGGLALLAAAAFLGLATSFLPVARGITVWEGNTVADLMVTLVELPLLLVTAVAVALPQARALPLLATILGGFLAAALFLGAADALGAGARGAWTFTNLILCGPLAVIGTCLVALRSYPSLGRLE